MVFLWWDIYGRGSCIAPVVRVLLYYRYIYDLVTITSSVIAIVLQCTAWPVGLLLKVDSLQQTIEKHSVCVIVVKLIA